MLEKRRRLTKHGSFQYMYKNGKKINSANLYIVYLQTKAKLNKFGFVVSNKVGKANKRNLIKRRLRAIIRENLPHISKANDYIIVAKEHICDISYLELKSEVLTLLKKGGFLIENN